MRRKDAQQVQTQLATLERAVDVIQRSLEKIEIVTVVREPNSGMAADAYNGLRKQVIAAVGERNAHLQQLADFDGALRSGATADGLQDLVRGWIAQAGVVVVTDAARYPDAFVFVGEAASTARVVRAAYVDAQTNRVIKQGLAEYEPARPEPPGAAEPATTTEPAVPGERATVPATEPDEEETR